MELSMEMLYWTYVALNIILITFAIIFIVRNKNFEDKFFRKVGLIIYLLLFVLAALLFFVYFSISYHLYYSIVLILGILWLAVIVMHIGVKKEKFVSMGKLYLKDIMKKPHSFFRF